MIHLSSLEAAQLDRASTVTIGVFDGVHRGHQYLIRQLVADAHANNRYAVVITFFPHPDVVLRGLSGRYYLTTPDERARLLGELGVDYVITLAFDEALRQIRAVIFVQKMLEHLQLASLWVGADFALGYKREGNVDFLSKQGRASGFSVHVVDTLLDMQHAAIKSTAIREALLAGDVAQAREWLGRAFQVSGEVVHGQARGRTIGFPTANIDVWQELAIPATGVYAGWATLGDERFMAVTNVGYRPTFEGRDVTVEAHLLDFDRDIYGQTLGFTFEKRLRAEQKFSGIEALIAQIRADADEGRAYLTQLTASHSSK